MKKIFLRNTLAFIVAFLLLFSVSCNASNTNSLSSEQNREIRTETDSTAASENSTDNQSETDSIESEPQSSTEDESNIQTESNSEDTSESESDSDTESSLPQIDEAARDEFYGTSNPATSYEEAVDRATRGELAGADFVPDQAPTISEYRPMIDGKYVKNTDSYYVDYNTYVVVNAYGQEVLRVYRGGGYITLEEIAAYIYAFGEPPANHSSSKRTRPTESIWGQHLRLNNTQFSGSTTKYPYEPELPRISGCGGDLKYWEMDIGTTGTDCDPGYSIQIYNNGTTITRGAARLVYTWNDLNENGITDSTDIVFIFYTYNHYNDFQEYLNYFGGWGEMFGNVTGGGKLSSKTECNPTPYVEVYEGSLRNSTNDEMNNTVIHYIAVILPQDLYYTNKMNVA